MDPPGPSAATSPHEGKKIRICKGCGTRMSTDKFDKHSVCSSCRGQACSWSNRCTECISWSDDFFKLYLKHLKSLGHKRAYKLKIKKSKSEQSAPISNIPTHDSSISPSSHVSPVPATLSIVPNISDSAVLSTLESESESVTLSTLQGVEVVDASGVSVLETPGSATPLSGEPRGPASPEAGSRDMVQDTPNLFFDTMLKSLENRAQEETDLKRRKPLSDFVSYSLKNPRLSNSSEGSPEKAGEGHTLVFETSVSPSPGDTLDKASEAESSIPVAMTVEVTETSSDIHQAPPVLPDLGSSPLAAFMPPPRYSPPPPVPQGSPHDRPSSPHTQSSPQQTLSPPPLQETSSPAEELHSQASLDPELSPLFSEEEMDEEDASSSSKEEVSNLQLMTRLEQIEAQSKDLEFNEGMSEEELRELRELEELTLKAEKEKKELSPNTLFHLLFDHCAILFIFYPRQFLRL